MSTLNLTICTQVSHESTCIKVCNLHNHTTNFYSSTEWQQKKMELQLYSNSGPMLYVKFHHISYEPCQPSFIFHCLMYQSQQAAMLRSLRRPVLYHYISIVYIARGTIYQHPSQTRGLMQHAGSTLSPLSQNKLHDMCLLSGCLYNSASFPAWVCCIIGCSFMPHL